MLRRHRRCQGPVTSAAPSVWQVWLLNNSTGQMQSRSSWPTSNPTRCAATYDKALLEDERRQFMQAWGDYLAMAEADNVVRLHPKAATTSTDRQTEQA